MFIIVKGLLGASYLPVYNTTKIFFKMRITLFFVDLTITCTGQTGHGSILHENTAGEKLQYIINKFMNWREYEKNKLKNSDLGLGDVTTINLTMINGGCQLNVVPTEISVTFDIRLAIDMDIEKMKETVQEWCRNAGPGVYVKFKNNPIRVKPTAIDDSNPWWIAFKNECDKMYV